MEGRNSGASVVDKAGTNTAVMTTRRRQHFKSVETVPPRNNYIIDKLLMDALVQRRTMYCTHRPIRYGALFWAACRRLTDRAIAAH